MITPSPAELGYYMPAEWQRHTATWLSWPKDPETWPGRVPQVQEIFLQMMAALAPHETVICLLMTKRVSKPCVLVAISTAPRTFTFIACARLIRGYEIMGRTFSLETNDV